MTRARSQPEVLGALALLLLYVAVMSGHLYSIDGLQMYRQALSLVQHGSIKFDPPFTWGVTYAASKYGIGLSLLYTPAIALMAPLFGHIPVPAATGFDWDLLYRDPVYAAGVAPVHAIVTALTAYFVARIVLALGGGMPTAMLALAAYGVASPALVYSRGDFAQPLMALCLTASLLAMIRRRRTRSAGLVWTAAALLCLSVLARPVEGSFLLPALLFLLLPSLTAWRELDVRAAAVLVGGYVVAVGLTLAINQARFGSPFTTGYSQISWGTPVWIGLPGVLLSPARGILWQFPMLVLAPTGFWQLWKSAHRTIAIAFAGLVLALLLNTALWIPWWGGWNWGARLFVPALPLAAVFAAFGATATAPSVRAWLVPTLLAWGVIWAVPGVLTDLLSGYGAAYDGTAQSFQLSGYPPIGAWTFLHHLRAVNLDDQGGIDIVWFRIAHATHNLSLVVPVALLAIAALLARAAYALLPRSGETAPRLDFAVNQSAVTYEQAG